MLKDMAASSKTSSIFIPHTPGAISDISSQIRNGFLMAQEYGNQTKPQ